MKWHTQRDVKASELVLARNVGDVFPEISASFIAAVGGSHVRAVAVHNLSEHAHTLLAMMAMNCKFIEHLCAYDCRNPRSIETLVRCWSGTLTSIVIERSGFNMVKFDELKLLHMQRLRLVGDYIPSLVRNLLCCCSGLKEVLMVDTTLPDLCIEAMEAHADSLTRLYLQDVHAVSDLALAAAAADYVRSS
jgi:hypothetical protein